MKKVKVLLVMTLLLVAAGGVWGQDTIKPSNIPTLNRMAEEYDLWKWVFGVLTAVLTVWSFLGLGFYLKTKVNGWLDDQIAKKGDLKIEQLKAALAEYSTVAELKKEKRILVISATEGQQANVKKVFDGCKFTNFYWKSMADLPGFVLDKTDLILINDQPELPLSQSQVEEIFKKFKTNVSYQYFGPKNTLPIGEYRKTYPQINLGLCNSADRLETGILSLLKII